MKRLRRMLADLAHLIDAVTQVIRQTRVRLSGEMPAGKTRRVSLHDDDARPIRKGSLATPTQFGYTGQVTDNRDGVVVDYELEAGMPPDAPRLAPAIARATTATGVVVDAVTADRGYGQSSVDDELDELGVELIAILRKGQPGKARQQVEGRRRLRQLVKWRTGAEGRISALKRQHGWGRAGSEGSKAHEPGAAGRAQPQRDQDRRALQLTQATASRKTPGTAYFVASADEIPISVTAQDHAAAKRAATSSGASS